MRTQSQKQVQDEQSLNEAFKDLSTLMNSAKEMVDFAQQISLKLSKLEGTDNISFQTMLTNLGIDDPVTRYFYYRYSKQIVEIIQVICIIKNYLNNFLNSQYRC